MASTRGPSAEVMRSAEAAIALVRKWLDSSPAANKGPGKQLAGLLRDPSGLKFAVGFIDGVVRPEDLTVAARNLKKLRGLTPQFLPGYQRVLLRIGANLGPLFPWIVIPVARRVLRQLVRHLIIDATDSKLGRALARVKNNPALRINGESLVRLNINLLGEAVLGSEEATKRLQGIRSLLSRPDVDYVSVKVSSAVAPHSPWAFDAAVDDICEKLLPLYEIANAASPKKFINLDMEEYHDLDLTIAVFKRILDRYEFKQLMAGIVLQAYLPDAMGAMKDLQDWSKRRREGGGAPIKVRLVKGANLPMERVDAEIHGWPLATWNSKQDSDANYKRVLEYALRADRLDAVELGIAGHNLFDLAFAKCLADNRGIKSGFQFEMLLGMATDQYAVVAKAASPLVLYTPVVHPREFDVAIAYLIRRLEEGASPENFMSSIFELRFSESHFEQEKSRFLASIESMGGGTPQPNRVQNRSRDRVPEAAGFSNAPDTDPATAANREWANQIFRRANSSKLGLQTAESAVIRTSRDLSSQVEKCHQAAESWQRLAPRRRAELLHKVGQELERSRAELIEVMMSEAGKTFDQADPEVSEAIDFAHYYAERALELANLDGATHLPDRLVLVTPPWNFPVAIPAGSTLAALASGAGVILKPANPASRCCAVLAEAIWRAGVPKSALTLLQISERALGKDLISNPQIDRIVLTGAFETAELFRSFRDDLKLLAETSGKNAMIITPSADLDLAAKDVAYSAFGHAGQKCSAASVAILVGSVARSERFRRQLLDAVKSLEIGPAFSPRSKVGPLIQPASGKLLQGLTELEPGESWLLEPRKLDTDGKLWSPGIRVGVKPGSTSHMVEYFGPVLALMTARNLDDALTIANQVAFGLTSGIHSLDSQEVIRWAQSIQAGNLYVNRGTTGAIVQRQPFGGWKRSAIGPGAKAGGPSYLFGFGSFEIAPLSKPKEILPLSARCQQVLDFAQASLGKREFERLFDCAQSDQAALNDFYLRVSDSSGLNCETNILRYVRAESELRLNESAGEFAAWRSALAARLVGSKISLDPAQLKLSQALKQAAVPCLIETESEWLSRINARVNYRVRIVGQLSTGRLPARPDLAAFTNPVTANGRIELMPYFQEQAISITAHRFGNQIDLPDLVVRALTE